MIEKLPDNISLEHPEDSICTAGFKSAQDNRLKINELVEAVNNSNRYGYPEYLPPPDECTKCGDKMMKYSSSPDPAMKYYVCPRCEVIYD